MLQLCTTFGPVHHVPKKCCTRPSGITPRHSHGHKQSFLRRPAPPARLPGDQLEPPMRATLMTVFKTRICPSDNFAPPPARKPRRSSYCVLSYPSRPSRPVIQDDTPDALTAATPSPGNWERSVDDLLERPAQLPVARSAGEPARFQIPDTLQTRLGSARCSAMVSDESGPGN